MKKLYAVAATFIFLSTGAPSILAGDLSPAVKREKIESLRRQAGESCRAGDYEGAIVYYKECYALAPDDPLVMKDLMWALWNRRSYADAADVARQIVRIRPKDYGALDMLARFPTAENRLLVQTLYTHAGQRVNDMSPADAVTLYRQLTALSPDNRNLAAHLLSGLQQLNEFDDGAQLAAYLVKAHPQDPKLWNWLGIMESSLTHSDAAIQAYRKSLELKPQQPAVHLLVADELIKCREFEQGVAELKDLEATDEKETARLYPLLATAQFWSMHYADSVPNWEAAVRLYPGKLNYQLYLAKALYYSGRQAEAMGILKRLYEVEGDPKAMNFIIDSLIVKGDDPEAEKMLENSLKTIVPADDGRVMRLSDYYKNKNHPEKLGMLLDRFLEVWPDHLLALQAKGDQIAALGRYGDALEFYNKVNALNPEDIHSLEEKTECQFRMGQFAAALESNARLREKDPSNPHYLCKEAQLRFDMGDRARAKQILIQWLEENRDNPVIPVLLYHGLTPYPDDPMLAYSYHHSTAVFDEHLKALSEAGYTPIVDSQLAAWYENRTPLPPKPVMITFDDGRFDSFFCGDPLLKKYNFRATMFAALVNIEGQKSPGYVSWDGLRAYRDTGRWEIQSHGDFAHIRVPSGPDGRQGLFLITRQWLEKENRFETDDEWQQRITNDHESSKRKLTEHLGETPRGFAFPEGYYGQDGNCTAPACALNTAVIGKYYTTLYTQSNSGINIGSCAPGNLKRFIPLNNWTGKDLLNHLETFNPYNVVYLQLFDFAIENKCYRDALSWVQLMEDNGAFRGLILEKESELYSEAGNVSKARALAGQAYAIDGSPQLEKKIKDLENRQRPELDSTFYYIQDNEHRQDWILDNTLSVGHTGSLNWNLRQQHGQYRQSDGSDASVIDNAGGVALYAPLGLFQRLSVEVMWHLLSGTAQNTYSASATLQSSWMDGLATRLQVSRSPYDTAAALNANVINTYGDLSVQWTNDGPWRVRAQEIYGSLSDGNRRETSSLDVSRSVAFSGALRAFYQFTYDNMLYASPDYYSPQSLIANGVGLELFHSVVNRAHQRRVDYRLTYMPAFTQAKGSPDEITNDIGASVTMHFGDTFSFKPSYIFYQAPSYYENRFTAELVVRF